MSSANWGHTQVDRSLRLDVLTLVGSEMMASFVAALPLCIWTTCSSNGLSVNGF